MVDKERGINPHHAHLALLVLLVLLCLTLFFFRLGTRPLWDTDEGMLPPGEKLVFF